MHVTFINMRVKALSIVYRPPPLSLMEYYCSKLCSIVQVPMGRSKLKIAIMLLKWRKDAPNHSTHLEELN